MKKYIGLAVIIIVIAAVVLAFTGTGSKICAVKDNTCSTACTIKSKANGSVSGFFCHVGCLWDNLGCTVKSWF